VPKTSALRFTTTTTAEDDPHASTRTGHKEDKKKKEKEKERRGLSNLFKASTSKIGPDFDLALETGWVEVSLERSVREERYGLWVRGVGGAAGLGAGAGQRIGFKYDPRALREAVFGGAAGAAGAMKRRKVDRAVEAGGEHTKDRGEAKREEHAREDVVLLAADATNERTVFVYRKLRPVQVLPTNTEKDMDKDKNAGTTDATPRIRSKRPREEEQDDKYGVVHDRKGQAIGSTSSTVAPATSTAATTTTTVSKGTTSGVRFAEGPKVTDGGGQVSATPPSRDRDRKHECRCRWKRLKSRMATLARHAQGSPPPAAETTSITSTATTTITSSTTSTTTTTTAAAAGKEKEPRLTRLEVEYHGKTRTAGTNDKRRGVIFPCKFWRWRTPLRITRVRRQEEGEGEGEGEEKKIEVEP